MPAPVRGAHLRGLVLLAIAEGDQVDPDALMAVVTVIGEEDDTVDWLGRARHPWQQLPRTTLRWDADTATSAVQIVTARRAYDERRIALALRGARRVCTDGQATVDLGDAVQACLSRLEREGDERTDVKELRHLARRVLTSAIPPDVLDFSLLVPGDAWAGAARDLASTLPA